jgi:hypothetical protein
MQIFMLIMIAKRMDAVDIRWTDWVRRYWEMAQAKLRPAFMTTRACAQAAPKLTVKLLDSQ